MIVSNDNNNSSNNINSNNVNSPLWCRQNWNYASSNLVKFQPRKRENNQIFNFSILHILTNDKN